MSELPTIAIIGAGNMGGSIISGLIKHGHASDKIWATCPIKERLLELKSQFHIHTTENNNEAILAADVIIIAVKPQQLSILLAEIKQALMIRKPLIISIVAGVPIKRFAGFLGNDFTLIRAMPNLPAVIGKAATALFTENELLPTEKRWAEYILMAIGIVKWLPREALMDSITALSGSGPAYFFYLFEVLTKAGVEMGLPYEIAHLFTLQTALGSLEMALKKETALETLREQVTSKGGTTEKALLYLQEHNIENLLKDALQTAKIRAEELGKELGGSDE